MPSDLIDSLGTEIERLWRSRRPTIAGVRQIARSVLLEAWDCDAAAGEPAKSQADVECGLRWLDVDHGRIDREATWEQSLLAARTIAVAATTFAAMQPQAEDLVIAALLADAASLRPCRPVGRDDPRHPEIAAALAAGLEGASISLPLRIGRHHERFDGTGFPAGLSENRLTTGDRLIAAAVRFAELLSGVGEGEASGRVIDAAGRLHDEARSGMFDPDLTANIVWSVTGSLPLDGGFGRPAPEPWHLTDRGRRRLRLDRAHESLPTPHFHSQAERAGQSAPSGRG